MQEKTHKSMFAVFEYESITDFLAQSDKSLTK